MSILDRVKRSAEVPQPNGGMTFSLARLLNQESYDTDPIKTDADGLKAYSGWVYACVSLISQDVRSSPWGIWQRAGTNRKEWKRLEGAQIPDILLRPSATQTWGDLIEQTQVHLDLAGRAFWHLITAGTGGKVVGIQIINPDWVTRAVYNDDKVTLKGWEISTSGSTRRLLPADDVILFRYPDPISPTAGMSPIRAVAMSADMDTYSRAYAASHLRNHAQPTGILTTEAELTKEQAALLAEGWQDSHQGTNKIQVLGKGAQFQVLGSHLKDLGMSELARVSRDQILSAFNVPASKLGLVEDSSRANGDEADRVYSALCLGPRLRRYEEPITYRLLPRLGLDPTRYSFEFDPVEVGDKEFERLAAENAFAKGAITLDEYRDRIGFEPEANGNGAVYFVPMGSTVTEVPETSASFMSSGFSAEELKRLDEKMNALLPEAEPVARALEAVEVEAEAEPEIEADDRELEDPSEDKIQIAALRFLSSQGDSERRMKGRIRAVFSRMQKAVVAAAKDGRLRSAMNVETRSVDDLDFLLGDFNTELQEIIAEEAWQSFGDGHEAFALEVAESVSPATLVDFDTISDKVLEWAREDAATKIKGITEVTVTDVRTILVDALEKGESIDEIAGRLAKKFDEYKGIRAETIARTETAGSYNFGKYKNAEQFDLTNPDFRVVKTWVSLNEPGRTRDAHLPSAIRTFDDRKRRSVFRDQAFKIGGERMMYPLDSSASAGNVIRCRCVLTFAVSDGPKKGNP